jgi:hypothetical protein
LPSAICTVARLSSPPRVVVILTSPASAAMPAEHQAQLLHQLPFGLCTQKFVGAAENGCVTQISELTGCSTTPW